MVRRAERALVQESGARSQGSGDAVDFGGFDGLFEGERGQDAGEALGEHRLARTWRTDHEDIVTNSPPIKQARLTCWPSQPLAVENAPKANSCFCSTMVMVGM